MLRPLLLCVLLAPALATAMPPLEFDGPINAATAGRLHDYMDRGGKTIVINSEGGDVSTAIALAEKMARNGVELVVEHYCMSSCANYLFLGAPSKSLRPGAVLGFHGAPVGTSSSAAFRGLYEANNRFYAALEIDTALLNRSYQLTRLDTPVTSMTLVENGKESQFEKAEDMAEALMACRQRNHDCSFRVSRQGTSSTKVWFPSRAILEQHGVRGIGAYPYPATKAELQAIAASIGEELEVLGDH